MKTIINYTILAVIAVDLLAMTGDSTMTWTSPMYPKLYSNDSSINPFGRPITAEEDTWIGSLINIGAMIGPFFFGYMSGKVGRRIALLSIALPHFIAYLTLAFAKNVYLYYFARLLAGLAVGGGYTLMPMYIAEIAEDAHRGKLSVTLNIFWTFGNLLPYSVGPYLPVMWFNLFLSCLPAIFFVVFFLVAPETPYYLVGVNKLDEARISLMLLRSRSADGVEKELELIKESIANEEHGHFTDLFKTYGLRKALYISLLLIIFQQLSGINAIQFYLQPIFQASGSSLSSDISSIIVGLVLFLTSFITPFLADRLGRRLLLICSSFGLVGSLAVLGAFFYLKDKTNVDTGPISWLPIVGLVLFIFFFNFGVSPVPWTISSELFPSSVRTPAASAVASACWFTSFFVTKFFNNLNDGIGRGGTFWLFGGFTLLAGIFSVFCVPETKGKSFSEIQTMLEK